MRLPVFIVVAVCVAPSSCNSRHGGERQHATDPVVSEVAGNLHFPLEPGMHWSYAGESDGVPYREEVETLAVEEWPAFGDVVPVVERRYLGGVLVEVSTEWFAVDPVGNVFVLGEESWVVHRGQFVEEPDNWRAVGGASPIAPLPYLPGRPTREERIVQLLPHGVEVREVTSLNEVVETPAGLFLGCIEILENPEGQDQDIVLYAPGTGIVAEQSSNGYRILTGVRRR